MEKARNAHLDIMRAIAAFMVVMIHVHPDTVVYNGIVSLCRAAVPFFFMVSGFYSGPFTSLRKERARNSIKKILKLVIISNLAYFGVELAYAGLQNELTEYIGSIFRVKTWIKFIVFNTSPFSVHLWYLSAYLYVLLIDFALSCLPERRSAIVNRIAPVLIPVLLSGDLIMGKYAIVLFGRTFPVDIVRNFLFVGLPYYYIGRMCSGKTVLARIVKSNDSRRNGLLSILMVTVAVACTLGEYALFTAMGWESTRDHYIGTTLLAVALLSVAIRYPHVGKGTCLETIGRKYSLTIYLIHPFIIKVLRFVLTRFDLYDEFIYAAAIAVYLLSLLAARTWELFAEKCHHKVKR